MSILHKGGDATAEKVKVHTIIVNGREKEF